MIFQKSQDWFNIAHFKFELKASSRRVTVQSSFKTVGILACAASVILCSQGSQLTAQESPEARPTLTAASPLSSKLSKIDLHPDQRFLAASFADGSAVVWDLKDRENIEVLRTPIREAEKTRTVGVAISPDPDAKWIAVGVPPLAGEGKRFKFGTGSVYIFDRTNKKLIPTANDKLDGLSIPTSSSKIKFSPDGEFLFALLSHGCGFRVWHVSSWQLIAKDDDGFGIDSEKESSKCHSADVHRLSEQLRDYKSTDIAFIEGKKGVTEGFVIAGKTGLRRYDASKVRDLSERIRNKEVIETPVQLTPVAVLRSSDLELAYPNAVSINKNDRRIVVADRRAPKFRIVDIEIFQPIADGLYQLHERYINQYIENGETKVSHTGFYSVSWLHEGSKDYVVAAGDVWLRKPTTPEIEAMINGIIDPKDPHRLLHGKWVNNLVVWEIDNEAPNADPHNILAYGNDTITDIVPLSGTYAFIMAAVNSIGAMTIDGAALRYLGAKYIGRNKAIDFRKGRLRATNDGKALWINSVMGHHQGEEFFFDLTALQMTKVPSGSKQSKILSAQHDFSDPQTDVDIVGPESTWSGTWMSKTLPRFFNKKVESSDLDLSNRSRSVAVSKNKDFVLWGTANALYVVREGADAAEIACSLKLRFQAWLVTLAAKDTMAVVAHSDGAVRWYRLTRAVANGRDTCEIELHLTLYAEQDGQAGLVWIAFTPNGEFYTNNIGRDIYGWQYQDKFDQTRFVNITEFSSKNLRPVQISQALTSFLQPKRVVGQSSNPLETQISEDRADYQITLPSELNQTEVISEIVPLEIEITAKEGADEWVRINLYINKKPVKKIIPSSAGGVCSGIDYEAKQYVNIKGSVRQKICIILPYKVMEKKDYYDLEIRYASAFEVERRPEVANFRNIAKWIGPILPKAPRRTFAVLIGFSDYKNIGDNKLLFAAKDAIDMAQMLVNQYKKEQKLVGKNTRNYAELNIVLYLSIFADQEFDELLRHLEKDVESIQKRSLKVNLEIYSRKDDIEKTKILDKLDEFIATTNKEVKGRAFKDTIIFHYAGHGLSIASGNSIMGFLVAHDNEALSKNTTQNSLEKRSISSAELGQKFEQAHDAEIIAIIDACQTLFNPKAADEQSEAGRKQQLASFAKHLWGLMKKNGSLFMAGGVGEEAFGLSAKKFRPRYDPLYQDVNLVGKISGNGILTHAIILAHQCKSAVRKKVVNAEGIENFVDKYFIEDHKDIDIIKKELGRLPIVFAEAGEGGTYQSAELTNPKECME